MVVPWTTRLLFLSVSHNFGCPYTTLCPTLRLDMMSLSVDCVFQVGNHKNMLMLLQFHILRTHFRVLPEVCVHWK